jgi:hypothetical protein
MNRPPGSDDCPHLAYRTLKVSPTKTELYCAKCGVLAGWWEDSQASVVPKITGKPRDLDEYERKELA